MHEERRKKYGFQESAGWVLLHHSSLDGSITLEWIPKTVRALLGRDTPWTIHRRHCGRIAELGRNKAAASRAVDKAPTQPFHSVRIAYI